MLFFYDQVTGAAGTGELDASGDYVSLNFPAGQFGYWSNIVVTQEGTP